MLSIATSPQLRWILGLNDTEGTVIFQDQKKGEKKIAAHIIILSSMTDPSSGLLGWTDCPVSSYCCCIHGREGSNRWTILQI